MMSWFMKNIIRLSGNRIIFPFYHIVSDEDCPHVKHLYPIKRIAKFEEELDFLQKYYQPIGLEELLNHIQNKTQPQKPSFFLTFDDGLRECHDVIAPILKKRNIPAAFFLNTGFVGNKGLFYRYKISLIIESLQHSKSEIQISNGDLLKWSYHDLEKIDDLAQQLNINFSEFLQNEKPYMSWEEIMELKNHGFYFGSHSIDHPLYKMISLEEQIRQTEESVNETVNQLDLDYRIFSFPFTDYEVKKMFFRKIFDQKICNLTFATAGIKNDEFQNNIQRFSMDRCLKSPEKFMVKKIVYFLIKKILRKQTRVHS